MIHGGLLLQRQHMYVGRRYFGFPAPLALLLGGLLGLVRYGVIMGYIDILRIEVLSAPLMFLLYTTTQ